jgi:protein-L-isoaspartate(D-aspartate) O-methyltransferase
MERRKKIQGLDRPQLNNVEVLSALGRVPREMFVPFNLRAEAFDDRALPIGLGQTISQPFIVGLMTQEAGIRPGARVLDIGTGSGYQAAVLAELGCQVYSIEIVPSLAKRAAETLRRCGYLNVHQRVGDGSDGWADAAPFNAILVAASSPRVPDCLLSQLADGGRLIIPIESEDQEHEELMLYQRNGNRVTERELGGVRFVDLVGKVREPEPNAQLKADQAHSPATGQPLFIPPDWSEDTEE